MSTSYKYQDLTQDSETFRVLYLQPGSETDIIQCLILTTSVSSTTSYEALSYCWGDQSNTKDILVEGYRFPVTTNLYAALHSLRSEILARPLWIDAICINQSSVAEQESQIKLMRDIYQQADGVVIWLGPSKPETGLAFELLRSLEPSGAGDLLFGTQPMTGRELQLQNEAIDNIRRLVISHPEKMECVQIFFSDVLTRDWWRRVWVLQEAALARSLVVKCGDQELKWDHFWGVTYDIGLSFQFLGNWMEAEARNKRSSDLERVHSIQSLRSMISRGHQIPLSDLVVFSQMRRATNAKDMIYGILGLTKYGTGPLFEPKYSKSVPYTEVYIDLIEQSISQDRSLDIITMSRSRFSTLGLPTWVPDWQALSRRVNVDKSGINAFTIGEHPLISRYGDNLTMQGHWRDKILHERAQPFLSTLWQASSDRPADAIISRQTPITLTSKGVCVDTIREVSTDKFLPKRWETMMLETFGNAISQSGNHSVLSIHDRCFDLVLRSTKDDLRNSSPMTWTFWLLMIQFWTAICFKSLVRELYVKFCNICYPREYREYIGGGDVVDAYAQTIFANPKASLTNEYFEGFWTGRELLGPDVKYRKVIQVAFMTSARCRRFFITRNGYIGLAPGAAQKGDFVCVLLGCSVPIVLRKEKNRYIFVGECYMHGIMDGEAIAMVESGDLNFKYFVIY